VPARLTRRGQLIAGVAVFAAALGATYAATAGGGEPRAESPTGSLAVPLELSAPTNAGMSLGAAEALPGLAPRRADRARQMVRAPAPVPAAPAPSPTRAEPSSVAAPGESPEPAPVPAPAPTPAPSPAPEPPPVLFDDSG
jgi:hypothetical protein